LIFVRAPECVPLSDEEVGDEVGDDAGDDAGEEAELAEDIEPVGQSLLLLEPVIVVVEFEVGVEVDIELSGVEILVVKLVVVVEPVLPRGIPRVNTEIVGTTTEA